ncbi:MAG: GntR family transcriptional regulator [Gammaproteobacteria bacterium]|nr:GntR family transcriptional regulator [Gammaproteobacteria bacterium]
MKNRNKGKASRKKRPVTAAELRFQRIYSELHDRIIMLQYPPGTVIRETDLAEEFGVSRTPIRQVLQRLKFEGLVETRNAVGTIVTEFDLESLKDAYEVRMKVGEWVGELAKRSYTDEDILEMEDLLKRTRNLLRSRDTNEYWRIANEVHQVLERVIDNKTLLSINDSLYYLTARSWFGAVLEVWGQHIEFACAELTELIKMMEAGDTRGVQLVRRNYIRLFLSLMDDHLQQDKTDAAEKTAG